MQNMLHVFLHYINMITSSAMHHVVSWFDRIFII